MSKFKVGDLVTPIRAVTNTTIGKPYEITQIITTDFMVVDDKGVARHPLSKYWTHYGQTLASDKPNWLPCPPDYKPQDNHEVSYYMGVPTHYYVKEPVLVDLELKAYVCKAGGIDGWHINTGYRDDTNATLRGKTRDGKPVGQWTIDMDAD